MAAGDNKRQGWSKETVRCVNILFFLFLLVIIIVITAVIVAMGGDDEPKKASNATNATNTTTSPNVTETNVTVASTPTTPTVDALASTSVFADLLELQNAVDDYLMNGPSALTEGYGASIGEWDVSNVKDFSSLFSASRNLKASAFNEDLSGWVVASAMNMSSMFQGADAFTGTGLDAWEVSGVVDMSYMFKDTAVFNADLSACNVVSVLNFEGMFAETETFNGTGLGNWPVSGAATISGMFCNANGMNPFALPLWSTDIVFCDSDISK